MKEGGKGEVREEGVRGGRKGARKERGERRRNKKRERREGSNELRFSTHVSQ